MTMLCDESIVLEKCETNPNQASTDCKTHQTVSIGKFHYQECQLLGEGRYGTVFKGFNSKTREAVAVKKVPNDRLKPDEVELMRSLGKSEFLIALFDCIQKDSQHTFVVMEFCDTDLAKHLDMEADNGKLRDLNFRVLLNSLAHGYGALWANRIVHRDIKPQNILLKYSKTDRIGGYPKIAVAKITDFGISRILEPQNSSLAHNPMRRVQSTSSLRSVAGTPYYMAPEVGANLVGEYEYDSRVDMWSIGCVLYQCITGQLPFNEQGLCKLFLKAACFNYDAYSTPQLPPDTTQELSSILKALLEIDIEKRLRPPEFYCAAMVYTSNRLKNRRRASSLTKNGNVDPFSWRHSVAAL